MLISELPDQNELVSLLLTFLREVSEPNVFAEAVESSLLGKGIVGNLLNNPYYA